MSDYISREALIDRLNKNLSACNHGTFSEMCYADTIETVKHLPAADVEPVRHGRWLDCEAHNDIEQCSECGMIFSYPSYYRYKFCPNCGAKMDLEDNDEN